MSEITTPTLNLQAIVAEAVGRSTRPQSYHHGEQHWKAVTYAGMRLCDLVPEADRELVFLFGLFHDTQRISEYADPDHGDRAALVATEMLQDDMRDDPGRLDDLAYAIRFHDRGMVTTEATRSVCWDADRLNLWRVGTEPDPELLSTMEAADMIDEAEGFHDLRLEWTGLLTLLALHHPRQVS